MGMRLLKMDGNSLNITQDKMNKLKDIVPEAFTEGKIDWEKLKAALGWNLMLNLLMREKFLAFKYLIISS